MSGMMTKAMNYSMSTGTSAPSHAPPSPLTDFLIRARWRQTRSRRLAAEEAADSESRIYEDREAENLRIESEKFLARQMEDMQALAEEQRKAGMLLDDGAPVKLSVSLNPPPVKGEPVTKDTKPTVFGQEEEEEEDIKKRKVPLVKLDFSATEGEKAKERLQMIKESVPHNREALFKAKVRWDGVSDVSVVFSLAEMLANVCRRL
jgi:RNA-binding protein 25